MDLAPTRRDGARWMWPCRTPSGSAAPMHPSSSGKSADVEAHRGQRADLVIVLMFLARASSPGAYGNMARRARWRSRSVFASKVEAISMWSAAILKRRGRFPRAGFSGWAVDYAALEDDLKAGSFLVPEGASMRDIATIVTQGGQSTCGTEVVYRVGVARVWSRSRNWTPPRTNSWNWPNMSWVSIRCRPNMTGSGPRPTPAIAWSSPKA